ncbi:MAG: alpha/beta fold hydrolase [Gammaproteobacteria bacterium]|nr:alpha/beta fold hydrolase [Gammaproteobacteria bacterium]
MENFRPAFWLRNPHVQSVLASSPMRKSTLRRRAQSWLGKSKTLLLNAEGAQLLAYWTPATDSQAPLIILIHGWEGTSESGYLLSIANTLIDHGYQILRLNLRDHDHSHHLNRELFHSCRLDEVVSATSDALNRIKPAQTAIVGFSLGGNFTLRVTNALSQRSQAVNHAVAVCPVLQPADTMQRLETGAKIYHHYFKRKWLRSINKKMALFPNDYSAIAPQHLRTLGSLTDYFVKHHTDYANSESYFNGYRIKAQDFANLSTQIDILMAEDDPIINAQLLEELRPVTNINVTYTRYGGHCGFIQNAQFDCWADNFILHCLKKSGLYPK